MSRPHVGGVQCPTTGNIYGIPSDAPDILKIDAVTKQVSRFGNLGETKNKWQGGVIGLDGFFFSWHSNLMSSLIALSSIFQFSGCAYFIPCDADHVLRFHFDTETCEQLGVGELPKGGDKWQGDNFDFAM